jgi:hypothetical protein
MMNRFTLHKMDMCLANEPIKFRHAKMYQIKLSASLVDCSSIVELFVWNWELCVVILTYVYRQTKAIRGFHMYIFAVQY